MMLPRVDVRGMGNSMIYYRPQQDVVHDTQVQSTPIKRGFMSSDLWLRSWWDRKGRRNIYRPSSWGGCLSRLGVAGDSAFLSMLSQMVPF